MKDAGRPRLPFTKADALLLALILVWGVNYTVIKAALVVLSPLAFNAARFALATVTVLVAGRALGGMGRLSPRDKMQAAALGVLANTVYQLLFIEGLARTNVAHAALIQASMPAQVALLSHFLGRERVTKQGWIGIVLTFLGLTLLLSARPVSGSTPATWLGDGLMLAASFSWAVYTLLATPLLSRAPAGAVTAAGFLSGTPLLILVALPELVHQDFRHLPPTGWASVLFSGVFAIGLGYFVWNYALRSLGTTRTAIYSNLTPVVAACVAWLFLGERWQQQQLAGAVLALGGITLTRFSQSHPQREQIPPKGRL